MTRDEIQQWLFDLMAQKFEVENPGLDDDLREEHDFDSIDAIELLSAIEDLLDIRLSQDDKKRAMDIRTPRQIIEYIETLPSGSAAGSSAASTPAGEP